MGHENEHDISVLSPAEMLKKLVTDVYFGNGKPALTIRVAGIEDEQEVIKLALQEQKDWQKNITKVLIGTLLSSIGGLILVCIQLALRH